jgi:hypothetical protein
VAPGRGAIRLTRVALFALGAVGLAVGAHLAGGEAVSPAVALASVPAVMIVVNLLAARRRGRISLLLAMGLTQLGLHLTFMITSATAGCHAASGQVGHVMAGARGGARFTMSCDPSMMPAGAAHRMWPTPTMALAHVLATVLMVLLLGYGESAIWALAACLRFRIALPGVIVRLPVDRRLPVLGRAALYPRSTVRRDAVRRRGPPVLARAVP